MCQHSWKIFRDPFLCMIVLQSMWKGPNHCWNFMESGSKSAKYASLQLQIELPLTQMGTQYSLYKLLTL